MALAPWTVRSMKGAVAAPPLLLQSRQRPADSRTLSSQIMLTQFKIGQKYFKHLYNAADMSSRTLCVVASQVSTESEKHNEKHNACACQDAHGSMHVRTRQRCAPRALVFKQEPRDKRLYVSWIHCGSACAIAVGEQTLIYLGEELQT